MKVLSITLSLAAVAMLVAAQEQPAEQQVTAEQIAAFDPLAPVDNNVYYAWAESGTPDEIAIKAEQIAESVSEIQFRSALLDRLEQEVAAPAAEFQAESNGSNPCAVIRGTIKGTLKAALSALAELLTAFPIIKAFVGRASNLVTRLIKLIDPVLDAALKGVAAGVDYALQAFHSLLLSIGVTSGLAKLLAPLTRVIGTVRSALKKLTSCLGGVSALSVESSFCYDVADLYRGLIEDMKTLAPALPADASPDLVRLASGTTTVLNLLGTSSIASKNEELLTVRPIFSSDLLEQYRVELERVANTEEWKQYAQVGLPAITASSNALEACLRVVSNPAAAREELDEDLADEEDYEEDYEDADEEADADEEVNEEEPAAEAAEQPAAASPDQPADAATPDQPAAAPEQQQQQ